MVGERTLLGPLAKDRERIKASKALFGHFPEVFGEKAIDNTLRQVFGNARELKVEKINLPSFSRLKVTATDTFIQFMPWRLASLELEYDQENNARDLRFNMRFGYGIGHEGNAFFSWKGQKSKLLTGFQGDVTRPGGEGLRLVYHEGDEMLSIAYHKKRDSVPTLFKTFFVNNSPFLPAVNELKDAQSEQALFLSGALLTGKNMLLLRFEGLSPRGDETNIVLPTVIEPRGIKAR